MAEAKTAVAASCSKVAERVGRLLGAPQAKVSAVFLGADIAAGSARRKWTSSGMQRRRLAAVKARGPRVRALRAAGGRKVQGLAAAGLIPQGAFGAEVVGLADAELLQLRRATTKAFGCAGGGRSLTRLLLVEGDPTDSVAHAPITRWAAEV